MVAEPAVAADETAVLPDSIEEVTEPTPETETAAQTPETDAPAAPAEVEVDLTGLLAKLGDDDLESLEPVKSLLNRKSESARRKTEHEIARRTAQERDTWAQSGQWTADLAAALTLDELGNPRVDTRKVNTVANGLLGVTVHSTMTAIGQVVDSLVSRDLQVPREVQSEIEDATREFMINPTQGKDRLVRSWMKVVALDAVEAAKPEIEKTLRKQWEKEREVTEKARATAKADQANAAAGTATRVAGGASGGLNIQSWDDAVDAFTEGKITAKQYGEYRAKFGKNR